GYCDTVLLKNKKRQESAIWSVTGGTNPLRKVMQVNPAVFGSSNTTPININIALFLSLALEPV
ncbi:16886_t:CDS:2, partial [Racocetra persica]